MLGAAVTGFALILVAAFLTHDLFRDNSFLPRKFDSVSWKTGDMRVRGEMVASLQEQSVLRGKSEDEVLAILGQPDEDLDGSFLYRLDVGRRMVGRTLVVALIVEFDERAQVQRAEVVDGLNTSSAQSQSENDEP